MRLLARNGLLTQSTCCTCTAVIKKALDEPEAVSCPIIGTESGHVVVLDPSGTSMVLRVAVPSVPAFMSVVGLLDVDYRIAVAGRNNAVRRPHRPRARPKPTRTTSAHKANGSPRGRSRSPLTSAACKRAYECLINSRARTATERAAHGGRADAAAGALRSGICGGRTRGCTGAEQSGASGAAQAAWSNSVLQSMTHVRYGVVQVFLIKNGELLPSAIELETAPCGLAQTSKLVLVACMNRAIHAYHAKGKKAYRCCTIEESSLARSQRRWRVAYHPVRIPYESHTRQTRLLCPAVLSSYPRASPTRPSRQARAWLFASRDRSLHAVAATAWSIAEAATAPRPCSIYLPAPVVAMELISVARARMVKALLVALGNGEARGLGAQLEPAPVLAAIR